MVVTLKTRGRPRLSEEERLRRVEERRLRGIEKRKSKKLDKKVKTPVLEILPEVLPETSPEVLPEILIDSPVSGEGKSLIVTEKVRNQSLRSFIFTQHISLSELTNESIHKEQEKLSDRIVTFKNVIYYVFKFELGKSGETPHFQGFVDLQKPLKFRSVTSKLPGCHIEKRRGTKEQAIAYVKKLDKSVERLYPLLKVVEPFPFKEKGQGKRNDLEDLIGYL